MNSVSQHSWKCTEDKHAVKPLMRRSKMAPMFNSAPTRIKAQNTFWDVEKSLPIFLNHDHSHDQRPCDLSSKSWGSEFRIGSKSHAFITANNRPQSVLSVASCDLVVPPGTIFSWKHDLHLLPRSEIDSD